MNKKIYISNIFFWGSIWGIMEASLGYLLHWTPQLISGNIMFAIGATILIRAYKVQSSRLTIFGVGLVATLIKGINLLMPNISTFKVLNPMISMIIQTFLFVVIIPVILNRKSYYKNFFIVLTSVLWRGAFVCYMVIQYFNTGYMQAYLNTYEKAIKFILINGMVGGIIAVMFIAAVNYVSKYILREYKYEVSPLFSATVMLLALALTVTL